MAKSKPPSFNKRQPKAMKASDFKGKFSPREKPSKAGEPKGRRPLITERTKPRGISEE